MKKPPIRVYYLPKLDSKEMHIFTYEMKTSEEKQQRTIEMLKYKLSKSKIFSIIFLSVFDIVFKLCKPFSKQSSPCLFPFFFR